MKRSVAFILSFVLSTTAMAAAVIWDSGDHAKFLPQLGFKLFDGKAYESVTANPTTGLDRPIGSVAVRDNSGTAEMWVKIGSATTAWSNVLTAATGWGITGNAGLTPGTNFLGTTDAAELYLKSNNTTGIIVNTDGTLTFPDYTTAGILHNDASGNLTSSLIVDADVSASAGITRSKLATGSADHVIINDGTGVLSSEARLSLSRFSDGTSGYPLLGGGAGSDSAYSQLDLTVGVTGTLPVGNGGTGLAALGAANTVLGVDAAGTAAEYKAIQGTTDQITVTHGVGTVTLSTPQDINTTSSPTFAGLTVGTLDGVLKASSGVVSASDVDLSADVTGTLPVENGGTGQSTATEAFDALGPGTTKGDVIVFDGTNHIRLGVGTDGQALMADSSEASGLIWGNPYQDPLTTKGDLLVHDGTDSARLGVGTDEYVLVADSNETEGVKWEARAKTDLSNLTATAISADLRPDNPLARSLGDATFSWKRLYIEQIRYAANIPYIDVAGGDLYGSAGVRTLDFEGSRLLTNSTVKLDWSGDDLDVNTRKIVNVSDPTDAQDAATKAYVDDAVSSGGGALTVSDTRAAPATVTAGGGITHGGEQREMHFVQGSSGGTDITANPQISAGTTAGQELIIMCRSDADYILFEDGNGLDLNGSFVCGESNNITLVWDGSAWVETARRE